MGDLTGKTAVVTGAGRGIGRAVAERLAADGARVGVHYNKSESAALEVVAGIEARGGSAFAMHAEMGVPGDAEELWRSFDEHAEGLDILVNNAGTGIPGSLSELTEEQFDALHLINAKAPFFVTKHALPRLRDGGRIINVGSFFTRIATPHAIGYVATKGLINAVTPALAWELGARDITVNVVSPGYVDTDMTTWIDAMGARDWVNKNTAGRRTGQPGDVSDVVAFLASDDARWVTGQIIEVTGGAHIAALPLT